jgi:hypothetical protein
MAVRPNILNNSAARNDEYEVWKKDRMGQKAFNLLMLRAHTYKKRDDKLDLIYVRKLIAETQ